MVSGALIVDIFTDRGRNRDNVRRAGRRINYADIVIACNVVSIATAGQIDPYRSHICNASRVAALIVIRTVRTAHSPVGRKSPDLC